MNDVWNQLATSCQRLLESRHVRSTWDSLKASRWKQNNLMVNQRSECMGHAKGRQSLIFRDLFFETSKSWQTCGLERKLSPFGLCKNHAESSALADDFYRLMTKLQIQKQGARKLREVSYDDMPRKEPGGAHPPVAIETSSLSTFFMIDIVLSCIYISENIMILGGGEVKRKRTSFQNSTHSLLDSERNLQGSEWAVITMQRDTSQRLIPIKPPSMRSYIRRESEGRRIWTRLALNPWMQKDRDLCSTLIDKNVQGERCFVRMNGGHRKT